MNRNRPRRAATWERAAAHFLTCFLVAAFAAAVVAIAGAPTWGWVAVGGLSWQITALPNLIRGGS